MCQTQEVRNLMDYVAATVTEPPASSFRPIEEELRSLERERMEAALAATGGNKRRAAQLIAMPLRTFSASASSTGCLVATVTTSARARSDQAALEAFLDPHGITAQEIEDADRFVLIGMSLRGRVMFVVSAERGERVRIVSARRATPSQRRVYEHGPKG